MLMPNLMFVPRPCFFKGNYQLAINSDRSQVFRIQERKKKKEDAKLKLNPEMLARRQWLLSPWRAQHPFYNNNPSPINAIIPPVVVRPLAPPVDSVCVRMTSFSFTSFIVRGGMVAVAEDRVDGKAVAMAQAATIELWTWACLLSEGHWVRHLYEHNVKWRSQKKMRMEVMSR